MNVRELLQIEIWSKETSRIIIGRIWKFLKPASIVFGILVLVLGNVYLVERYWLTGDERKAGRTAMVQVEELEQVENNASDRFDDADKLAKAAITVAQQKAWTLRDRWVAGELEFYRWKLEQAHDDEVREKQLRSFSIQRHLEWRTDPDLEKKMRDSDSRIFSMMRSELHKELD